MENEKCRPGCVLHVCIYSQVFIRFITSSQPDHEARGKPVQSVGAECVPCIVVSRML